MRKIFVALLVAALAVVGLGAGSALAASNGNHDQGFTCTTTNSNGQSTTFTSVFSYHETGLGTSATNTIVPDRFAYHTTPLAKLDAVYLILNTNNNQYMLVLGATGQAQLSANDDVPSSGTITSGMSSATFADGTTPNIRVLVQGGVGTAGGSCNVEHAPL
jgi:hypothetical protein